MAVLFFTSYKTAAQSKKVADVFPDTAMLDEIIVTGTGLPVSINKIAVAVHSLQVKDKNHPCFSRYRAISGGKNSRVTNKQY